jgi:drug/metabolite transporter (DMT)-like permease
MDTLDTTDQPERTEQLSPRELRQTVIRQLLKLLGGLWAFCLVLAGICLMLGRPLSGGSDGLIWTAVITGALSVLVMGLVLVLNPKHRRLFITVAVLVFAMGTVAGLCVCWAASLSLHFGNVPAGYPLPEAH